MQTHYKDDYEAFLASKRLVSPPSGLAVNTATLNPMLFPFQRDIVEWALRRGKAAVFADCGLGKTPIQLEWARKVAEHTGGDVLILAPLAVSQQTVREGQKFGIDVTPCRSQEDVRPGINITNYEMLDHFQADAFCGLVMDESSLLKAYDGIFRKKITQFALAIPFRLAATATPAPNDLIELTNHAEFLEIMSGKEIIALFFTQDGNTTHNWRLKGHAKEDFWRWMASWSVALRKPSDLGYEDGAFRLPELRLHQITVDGKAPEGMLFPVEALTLTERRRARKDSLAERVQACAEIVNADSEPWIVWCNLNAEGDALTKAIPGAVQVTGSDTAEDKERTLLAFAEGKIRVLVTKPTIAGHGMNFQHCAHMAFVGLSDSWEQYYQAIRRCWRFGQTRPVEVYIITAETEGAVVKNIERKEVQAAAMMDSIVRHMAGLSLDQAERSEMVYREDIAQGKNWTLYLGDSVERIDEIETESVGLAVFSPPFPMMYAYTNSVRDMGNVKSIEEMLNQFRFLAGPQKLGRVLMPGRLCCVHISQAMAHKNREGYIGIHDFRGNLISLMQEVGWIYAGEVTIDKDPQVKATRTKEMGLLYQTLSNDASMCRMALADYLLYFRKPGENPVPIRAGISERYNPGGGWITQDEWNEWAAPVWYGAHHKVMDRDGTVKTLLGGIKEGNVLNVVQARETDDERHLAPLQLGVIERAVKLWSAPGDLVLSPFAGIGSEGYVSVGLNRRFVGIELKESYFRSAVRNITNAEHSARSQDLFEWAEVQSE